MPTTIGWSALFACAPIVSGNPSPEHEAPPRTPSLLPFGIRHSVIRHSGQCRPTLRHEDHRPTGDYASITAAIADVQVQTLGGALVLELQPAYISTVETFPLVFTNLTTTAANTLTLRPQSGATALNITSADTTAATVDLNGAKFVTLDGRPGGNGTAKEWTIANTSTSGRAVRFINDASTNTLRHLTLRGVNTSASSGTVVFMNTIGPNGNDNNTIDTCDIRDGATAPANAIYSLGTTTTTAHNNSGNTISNCNVLNFYPVTATESAGIRLDGGNTDWTITGDSFYQTESRAGATANLRAVDVNNPSGSNFTINGNFIGGTAPSAAGAAWPRTTSIYPFSFQGIRLNTGTATPSSVQGNIIRNIAWISTNPGTVPPGIWIGIYVQAGSANIGNVTGNTIGAGTGTDSVSVTSHGNATAFGIGSSSSATLAIVNNTIGSMTVFGAGTNVTGSLAAIHVTAGTNVISNNTIGSTTTANSLNAATASISTINSQRVTGILSSSGSSTIITNNTVANLNNNYASTVSSSQIRGIVATAGLNTIAGNTVRNLSTSSQVAGLGTAAAVLGIAESSGSAGQTVSRNIIHSLSNSAASADVAITGIYYSGNTTSGPNNITRNFMHSFSVASTSVSSSLRGMDFGSGTFTAQNNIVRLGISSSGASTGGAAAVLGIVDNNSVNSRNFYHNSVYVGGTQTSGSTDTTACLSLGVGNTRAFRNNIFVNARVNGGGSSAHYAVRFSGTGANPAGLAANNNLYFVTTGSPLGFYSAFALTLAQWQAATGVDAASLNADPLFVNPVGTAPRWTCTSRQAAPPATREPPSPEWPTISMAISAAPAPPASARMNSPRTTRTSAVCR